MREDWFWLARELGSKRRRAAHASDGRTQDGSRANDLSTIVYWINQLGSVVLGMGRGARQIVCPL